jgi:hypothetical protein
MRFAFNVLVVLAIGWLIAALAAAFERLDEHYLSHPEVMQREWQNLVSPTAKSPAVPASAEIHAR